MDIKRRVHENCVMYQNRECDAPEDEKQLFQNTALFNAYLQVLLNRGNFIDSSHKFFIIGKHMQ